MRPIILGWLVTASVQERRDSRGADNKELVARQHTEYLRWPWRSNSTQCEDYSNSNEENVSRKSVWVQCYGGLFNPLRRSIPSHRAVQQFLNIIARSLIRPVGSTLQAILIITVATIRIVYKLRQHFLDPVHCSFQLVQPGVRFVHGAPARAIVHNAVHPRS
jgi:hypothetical protein